MPAPLNQQLLLGLGRRWAKRTPTFISYAVARSQLASHPAHVVPPRGVAAVWGGAYLWVTAGVGPC